MCLFAGCADDPDPIAVAELKSASSSVSGRAELFAPDADRPAGDYDFDIQLELPDNKAYEHAFYNAENCDVAAQSAPLVRDYGVFERNAAYAMIKEAADEVIGKIYVIREPDTTDGKPGAWLACGRLVKQ